MSRGPRKQSLYAGRYAAGGLGDAQPPKPASEDFFIKRNCKSNRHTWLRGYANWVCSRCGHVSPISKNPESPPPPDP